MKELERKFSKTDRIVARAKFTGWVFLSDVVFAAVLGALIAVVWVFRGEIEGLFNKTGELMYLTDANLRYAVVAAIALVLIVFVLHAVKVNRKEMIITEDKIVLKAGVVSTASAIVPVTEVKMVESEQNIFQRILGYGRLVIICQAEKPYIVKNVASPEKLARRIMKQTAEVRNHAGKAVMHNVKFTLVP